MDLRRHLVETATLVAAAAVCAVVSNSVADNEKKLALVGKYKGETTVPQRRTPPPAAVAMPLPELREAVSPEPPAGQPTSTVPLPMKAGPLSKATAATIATTATAARLAGKAPSAPVPSPVEHPKERFAPHGQPYREVSGEDVVWLHARPGALFLDARRTSAFQEGHLAGARSFPIWEDAVVTPRIEALAGEGRDGDAPVVVYCSGGNCEDSHMLCEKLFGLGFNNLLVYRDGWPDWQKRGGASRTGPEP